MATLLTKTRTVCEKTETFPDGSVCFEQESEEYMPRPIKSIFLDKATFEDLGSPERLAVTIEAD